MITLSLEAIAKSAPDVTFIHEYPGHVKTNSGRDVEGIAMAIFIAIYSLIGPFLYTPPEEASARHLYISTTARYPPRTGDANIAGVPLAEGDTPIGRGTDGKTGSGVYSLDNHGKSANPKVEEILEKHRASGAADAAWNHTIGEFERIATSRA